MTQRSSAVHLRVGSPAKSFFRGFLGPRVAERGGTIEDRAASFRIYRIGEEVAQPLELEVLARCSGGQEMRYRPEPSSAITVGMG